MKKIIVFIISSFFIISSTYACTTAVVSGKYTKDGRPMLWKHRDTWAVNNKLMVFHDGKYVYTGLVNSKDKTGKSVWIGYNSTGFAIMNSASYNLNNDTIRQSGLEGRVMKQALQTCATIDDFEKLLNDMPKPTRLEANFGVIDGKGGAAYFELSNFKVVKFDANDASTAPMGYIVRSNYSFSGTPKNGAGYIRYVTANKVLDEAVKSGGIVSEDILQGLSRNLTNSLTNENLWQYDNLPAGTKKFVWFEDFIPRSGSASSCVVEGIKPGEDARLTTMWSIVGWPLASVAIPVWITKHDDLPVVVSYNDSVKDSPLCHYALELKKKAYCYDWGKSAKHYLNVNALLNAEDTGIMQKLKPVDDQLIKQGHKLLDAMRRNGYDAKKIKAFYNSVDKTVVTSYNQLFGL
ncbi:MAG: hypothetical protein DRJ09_04140 [Bacteroidetes bacterium]|nr:MAG: hypothetical protein DRJ09_04140 [Bacteroidota bacterium]